MITTCSQSSLGMCLRCGEQCRRRYIEGEVIPPGIAAIRGTSLHKANQVNMLAKLRTGQDEPLDLLLDAAEEQFRKSAAEGIYLPREEAPSKEKILEDGLKETLSLTSAYRQTVAPEIRPKQVERKFVVDAGFRLPLTGIIDVLDHEDRIQDLKGSGKKWAESRILEEIQPVFYSLAHEHEYGTRPYFRYHVLIPYKSGAQRQILNYRATDAAYGALAAKIRYFEAMLQAGLFPPAHPGAWWCSERWCGYWSTCPYVGNGQAKKWV